MGIPPREEALSGKVAMARDRGQEDSIARERWDRVYQEGSRFQRRFYSALMEKKDGHRDS